MTAAFTPRATPKPRRQDFAFDDDIPLDWFGGDAFISMLMTGLSGTFPEGERFFVDSVRHYQSRISAELQKPVRGFIGQEAHHSKEHDSFNAMMARKGLPMQDIDHFVGNGMRLLRKHLSSERQLAMTCALEHFTAILAEVALDNPDFFGQMDERVRKLWYWHAIEEAEHKAVAFDVFQEQVGSYWIRSSQMLINTIEFTFFTGYHAYQLLHARGLHKDWRLHARGLKKLFVSPGWLRPLGKAYLAYYRPDFHPWQRDNSAAVAYWKQVYGIA